MDNRKAHNPFPFDRHPAPHPGPTEMHRGFPVYVADGDTHEYLVEDHLDLHKFGTKRIRLADINTWENFGPYRDPVRGPAASKAAADILGLNETRTYEYSLDRPVMVELHLRKFNRQRQIGRVFVPAFANYDETTPGVITYGGIPYISIATILRAGGHEDTTRGNRANT